ncbi:Hypothetical_protein [Hexamita inflata]|uniref:Hypothetical_protein n=1 Tax=Hexamita inflata TaxID=28002 RepID=A0AA86USE0_9EUKA|nr:Hypothetical protein HINF_LOCUS57510 [Hexamita inflata]
MPCSRWYCSSSSFLACMRLRFSSLGVSSLMPSFSAKATRRRTLSGTWKSCSVGSPVIKNTPMFCWLRQVLSSCVTRSSPPPRYSLVINATEYYFDIFISIP